jgi:hypothetical protein
MVTLRYYSIIRALFSLYFLSTFSYVHLPFAVYHHSLGSLFNYFGGLIILLSVFYIPLLKFSRHEAWLLFSISSVLMIDVICQGLVAFIDGFTHTEPEMLLRSFKAFFGMLLPLISVIYFIKVAEESSFSFKYLSEYSRYSLYILLLYLIVEVLGSKYGVEPFRYIVAFVSKYLNYRDEMISLAGRIRGFSNEPSYMAVPVIFLVTILLIDKNINNVWRYFLLLLLFAVSAVSLSKNLLIGLVVLSLLHGFYYRKAIPYMILLVSVFIFIFYINIEENIGIRLQYESHGIDYSTVTRVGSWVAAWEGFLDYPIFGRGLGLAGKFIVDYYPKWFYLSPEASKWVAASENIAAPVFSNLFRLLFEMGAMGVIILFIIIYGFTRKSNDRSLLSHDNILIITGYILSYCMVDVLTYWPWYILLGLRRNIWEVRC